jgi:hypothetical protein
MLKVTLFQKPGGRQKPTFIKNIYPEDEAWFIENKAEVSMEEIRGNIVLYADIGLEYDGEPDEVIEISQGKTCEETFAALRKQCELLLKLNRHD